MSRRLPHSVLERRSARFRGRFESDVVGPQLPVLLLLLLLHDLHQLLLDLLLILARLLRDLLHELIRVALPLLKILFLEIRELPLQLRLDLLEVLLKVLLRLLIDQTGPPFGRRRSATPRAAQENACTLQGFYVAEVRRRGAQKGMPKALLMTASLRV
jgi:hypothetical protein